MTSCQNSWDRPPFSYPHNPHWGIYLSDYDEVFTYLYLFSDHILGEDSGLLWNLSVVLSNPEFLYCDPKTIDSIIGFEPNPEQHETYINIETVSRN